MGKALPSRSPTTLSWVMARSHWPMTDISWNNKTRYLGSAGALRIAACRPAKASSSLPWRTSSSMVLMTTAYLLLGKVESMGALVNMDIGAPMAGPLGELLGRSEEHTSELQSPCNI